MEKKKFDQYKEYFNFSIEQHIQKKYVLISEIEFLANDLKKFVKNLSYNLKLDEKSKENLDFLLIDIKTYEKEFISELKSKHLYSVIIPFYMSFYRIGKKDKESQFVKDKLYEIKEKINSINY